MPTSSASPEVAGLRQALQRLQVRLAKHPEDGHALDETAVLLYQAGQPGPAVGFAQRAAVSLARFLGTLAPAAVPATAQP